MAERRMLAKNIIESDAFYDLSDQEQVLYLHLSMNTDDDGVCDNARTICRSCGYDVSVLQGLVDKRFLLKITERLYVIKHWKINNYIQKDRYKPTAYSEEFKNIKVKENGAYTEAMYTQEGDGLYTQEPAESDTQYRLGKVRLGKVSIEREGDKPKRFTPPTADEVKAYCEERGNNVDPERFIDFYASKGWKVGNQGMKDWKAAVRTWEKRDTQSKDTTARAIEAFLAEE